MLTLLVGEAWYFFVVSLDPIARTAGSVVTYKDFSFFPLASKRGDAMS